MDMVRVCAAHVAIVIAACGPHSAMLPDAEVHLDGPIGSDVTVPSDGPIATDPFWPACGDEAVDLGFVESGVPFAVARDGTMYSVIDQGGTVIARKRPDQAAEMTWLTVAPQQIYAVEGLAPGPVGTLYFTGYV